MSRSTRFVALLASLSLFVLAGCGPEPLENQNNQGTTNQSPGDSDGDSDGEGDEWDAQFVQVAEIVRATCAVGACHGSPTGNTDLDFGGNTNAVSNETIRGIFESYTSDNGHPLVDPGNPDNSDLYLAVTSTDQDVRMPRQPVAPLSGEQIAVIRSWIEAGANYR